jgi:hypothetical protein
VQPARTEAGLLPALFDKAFPCDLTVAHHLDDAVAAPAGQRVCVAGSRSFEQSPDVEVLAPAGSGPTRQPAPLERAAMAAGGRLKLAPGELLGTIIDLQPSGIGVLWSTAAHSDVVGGEMVCQNWVGSRNEFRC